MPDDLIKSLAEAIREQEGICPDPSNCKNNNPGAIQAGGKLASYPDYQTGYDALVNQIHTNIGRGLNLQEFFGGGGTYPGYSPKAAGNDPVAYSKKVASKMGIDETTPLHKLIEGFQMPQDQQVDYSTKTDAELLELAKKDPELSKLFKTPDVKTTTTDKKGTVKPPEKGFLQRWAEAPQSITSLFLSPGQGGVKQFVRGAAGDDMPWAKRANEMIEGGEKTLAPAGVVASLAAGASGLLPLILGTGTGIVGSEISRNAAPEITKDPEKQKLIENIGGLASGMAGGIGGPKLLSNPAGRAALGAVLSHAVGGNVMEDILGALLAGGSGYLPGRMGRFARGASGGGGAAESKAATGPVAAPGKPLPKTGVEDEMLKTGSLTPEQYVQRMKDMGMDEGMAKAKMQHAIKTHLQEAADKAAKSAPSEPRSPVVLKPSPIDQTRTATPTGGTPTNVQPLPGVQAVPNLPVGPPPIGPAASGTGPGLQITPSAPPPAPPPSPGSMGTVGPLPPNVQGPPLQGPPATGTPVGPPLNAPPIPPPDLGTVGPLGTPPPRVPLASTVPKSTPLGAMPPTPLETIGKAIADAAVKAKVKVPKSGNLMVRKGFARKLGLDTIPSKEELVKAAEILEDRERAAMPTARNP